MAIALHQRAGLVAGHIQKRYKRFLADVELLDGSLVTAHCANTGAMTSCWAPGDLVLLEPSARAGRKLPYTWLACQRGDAWIGVDTSIPNKIVAAAAQHGLLPGLPALRELRAEVPYGSEGSRIDLWGREPSGRAVFIEVKNATLRLGERICFPDAVTARGRKHLRELTRTLADGHRALLVFLVNRMDGASFDAARDIDPAYGEALDQAAALGVEVLPLRVRIEAAPEAEGWRLTWHFNGLMPWVKATAP